jgi:uncharacterized RDD family membrane protein YckC
MSTITCPHCGFSNFSISAYCSKCERPLQGDLKSASRAAPRPPTVSGAPQGQTSLPSASQVAQQILQRRPPVPTPPPSAPLPPAQQVARQILQKRAAADDASVDPTVIARLPVETQRALVGERAPAAGAQQKVVLQNRPPLQPMPSSPHTDPTRAGSDLDRTTPDPANEATAVSAAPVLLDKRATQAQAKAPSNAAAPRPVAGPSLPQPAQARDVIPTVREPAARPAPRSPATPTRRPPAPVDFSRTEPGIAAARPATRAESPFPRTEPGVAASVLHQGAAPPKRTAPKPPVAAPGALEAAAGWRILLGYVVDIALIAGFFALLVNLDAALTGPRGLDAHGKMIEFLANHPGSTLRAGILTMLAATAYHVTLNHLNGRTVGRMIAGTALARRSGRPMSWFIVSVRTVASFVSLLAFGAGFFWAIVDNRGRGFHDLVAGTMVVRYRRA